MRHIKKFLIEIANIGQEISYGILDNKFIKNSRKCPNWLMKRLSKDEQKTLKAEIHLLHIKDSKSDDYCIGYVDKFDTQSYGGGDQYPPFDSYVYEGWDNIDKNDYRVKNTNFKSLGVLQEKRDNSSFASIFEEIITDNYDLICSCDYPPLGTHNAFTGYIQLHEKKQIVDQQNAF